MTFGRDYDKHLIVYVTMCPHYGLVNIVDGLLDNRCYKQEHDPPCNFVGS